MSGKDTIKEEIRYKMIYYGKGTYYYKLLSRELEKIDFSVCDKLKKYIQKINSNDDDEDVKIYVDELQKFIEDYEVKYLKQKLK